MAEKAEKSAKFATELWDGFDTISKHTANELQFCKDVHKFFKRRVEIEQEFAKSMSKLAQKNPLSPQGTLKRAWEDVLCHTQNVSNIHTNTATQITEKVTDSVAGLIKDVETTRKQLVNEGTALNNEYSSNVDSLKKAKSNYEKACKDSELARKTYDAVKVDGVTKQKDLPKFEKDAAKKKLAAQQADEQYKKRVEDTNNFLEVYYTEKMPKILSQFEHLESVRIHMIKSNLRKYLQVLEYVPSLHQKEAKLLQDTVEKINNEADIDLYCKQYKTGEEIPQPFEYEPYIEGSDQNIQKKLNKLEQRQQSRFAKLKSGVNMIAALPNSPGPQRASGPKEDASFCVPIQTLMDKQKAKYPDLEVPRLLVLLSETIIKLEGTKTEGIFRVPASADDVKALRERLDDGDYECLKQVQNVHTPCALFKLWLRELPEPIIPTALYETCTENPTKGLELLQQQSPPVNLKVIAFIIDFIHKLATPEITEITKMSKDNLSMVFAPSFLRCPYTDYRALSSAEKEKQFVLLLVNNFKEDKETSWKSVRGGDPVSPKPITPTSSTSPTTSLKASGEQGATREPTKPLPLASARTLSGDSQSKRSSRILPSMPIFKSSSSSSTSDLPE